MQFETILPFLRPIEHLILDPDISEIMVNADSRIFIEKHGQLLPVPGITISEQALCAAVKNIARRLGDDISEAKPILDSRLPDGSRVAAVLPPCSIDGITLTIRKFNTRHFTIADLIANGTLTDTAELNIRKSNLVRFETRREQAGIPAVTVRDLLKAALRHRPDRIIVGEVRGGEAFDLLQALNTGHSGSLCTLHANSARQAIARFSDCVLQSGIELPHRAIMANIGNSVYPRAIRSSTSVDSPPPTSMIEVEGPCAACSMSSSDFSRCGRYQLTDLRLHAVNILPMSLSIHAIIVLIDC
jgi:pilus assembly protein CpaF